MMKKLLKYAEYILALAIGIVVVALVVTVLVGLVGLVSVTIQTLF